MEQEIKEQQGEAILDEECLTLETFIKYIKGELGPIEKQNANRHLVHCEFCREALNGLTGMDDSARAPLAVKEVNKRIRKRISAKNSKSKNNFKWIAAVFAIVIFLGSLAWIVKIQYFDNSNLSYNESETSSQLSENDKASNSKDVGKGESMNSGNVNLLKSEVIEPEQNDKESEDLSEAENQDQKLHNEDGNIDNPENAIVEELNEPPKKNEEKDITPKTEKNDNNITLSDKKQNPPKKEAGKNSVDESKVSEKHQMASSKAINVEENDGEKTEEVATVPPENEKVKKPASSNSPKALPAYLIEENPVFPGGERALQNYLKNNLTYPQKEKQEGISGTVILEMIINEKGNVTNVQVVKGIDPELDKEALRVVKSMPDWKPGKNRGKVLPVIMNLPVTFE